MASTYRELLSRVDLLLGEPHPANPSQPTRWEVFQGAVQLVYNVALNAPVSWVTRNTTLSVYENQDTYTLNHADFSKDILVETIDLADPTHVSRPVSRSSLQSEPLTFFPQSGESVTVDGVMHSARVMAFYREDGVVKVRVMPMPTTSADYRVWFETASPNTDSDLNSLFSPAGESYIVTLCALNLLPHCQWAGMGKEETKQKRRDLKEILAANVAVHEKAWRVYLATDRQSGVVRLRGFDDEGEENNAYY